MTRTFGTTTLISASICTVAAGLAGAPLRGQTHLLYTASESSIYSSSLPTEATEGNAEESAYGGLLRPVPHAAETVRPFHDGAVSVKVGSAGIGFDVAMPITRSINLRSGASFFSYNTSFTTDGLNVTGSLHLENASTNLDIYPFRNSFRISPGLTFRNDNRMNATLAVPGGQSFSLGDGNYTSDPADPIHGTAAFIFGHNLAPRLTMGFGNMIPHGGGSLSFPVEFGFQYINQPTVALSVAGSSCGNQVQASGVAASGCGPVEQTDVVQEQNELQNDLSPLRFYPIASIGVSYRLGHGRRAE